MITFTGAIDLVVMCEPGPRLAGWIFSTLLAFAGLGGGLENNTAIKTFC
jgi:hypothetical protein